MSCKKVYKLQKLLLGIPYSFTINASCEWNNSGIIVERGYSYVITASGNWVDLNVYSDANGYKSGDSIVPWYSRPFLYLSEYLRKQPKSDWFRLIGCIGTSNNCFDIGKTKTIEANIDGALYFYANDLPLLYGNNKGVLTITITKINIPGI